MSRTVLVSAVAGLLDDVMVDGAERQTYRGRVTGGRVSAIIQSAAGENMRGDEQFDAWIAAGVLGVIQPDMCKWGGFSGTLPVARRILESGDL